MIGAKIKKTDHVTLAMPIMR